MKCNHCGAEVASDAENCPYCNSVNPIGAAFQAEIKQKKEYNKHLKKNVIDQNKDSIIHKLLSRAILISIILLILNIAIGFCATLLSTGDMKKPVKRLNAEQTMESFAKNKEYDKLYIYMSEQDLFSNSYYTYSQMALLHFQYERFLEYRNECINQIDKNNLPDEHNLSYAIRYAIKVLHPNIYAYPEIQPESAVLLQMQEEQVIAFFKGYLKLTQEELAVISGNKKETADTEDLASAILQRNSGGFRNEP